MMRKAFKLEGPGMRPVRRLAALAALVVGMWMLTGIEVVGLEHSDKYVPFIKARPSLQLLYRNPVMCGECNFRSYTTLDAAGRRRSKRSAGRASDWMTRGCAMRCSRRSSGLLSRTACPSARDEAGEFSSTTALQRERTLPRRGSSISASS